MPERSSGLPCPFERQCANDAEGDLSVRRELQTTVDPLLAALLRRLEDAEALAARSLPASSTSSIRHVAALRQATAEAATLAAAIEVLASDGHRRA
jgi:hypothetical protein